MEPLCQACVNSKSECVCSKEFCNECGCECDGVHSVTKTKSPEDKAEELAKIVLSYDKKVIQLVIQYLQSTQNE